MKSKAAQLLRKSVLSHEKLGGYVERVASLLCTNSFAGGAFVALSPDEEPPMSVDSSVFIDLLSHIVSPHLCCTP